MSLDVIVALIVFLFPLAYSPGPGNSFFAAVGARSGLRGAIPALAGYHLATLLVTFLIGMGVGLALLTHPTAALVMRVGGALYVLWIALSFLRAAIAPDSSQAALQPAQTATFVDGAVLLILNPKAYLIIGLLFTQFLTAAHHQTLYIATIAAVFTLNNLVAFTVWTAIGAGIGALFTSPGSQRWVNFVFAACLGGVAWWMAIT